MPRRVDLSDLQFLVLDDSVLILTVLHSILNAFGVRKVWRVRNLAAAAQAMTEHRVDFAIVDRHLDREDGLDFVRALRAGQFCDGPYLPVIVLTAYTTRQAMSETLLAGAHDVLCKPASARTLYKHVIDLVLNPRRFVRCGPLLLPMPRGATIPAGGRMSPEQFLEQVTALAEGRRDPSPAGAAPALAG